ncbi:MAG: NAD(P)-binding protein, partial [Proteobacteria bacterium]|nr:NAD(P)-binding protein [Pseudomonadota bacterium]
MARQKIAVIGGGVGAMSTVFELTEQPGWQDNYEITVYQLGWRLGGKGASGRNKDKGDRIEEHGLHFWFGYYENAFNLIQRVYA